MPPGVPGRHFICRLRGRDVAAVASRPGTAPSVSAWNTYVWVEDAEETAAKVRDAGGSADEKMPIPQTGWFARCKDTEGNPFSLFQSDESVAPPGQ
jgi:predicted enzyme related to lactoylglutathione lyase